MSAVCRAEAVGSSCSDFAAKIRPQAAWLGCLLLVMTAFVTPAPAASGDTPRPAPDRNAARAGASSGAQAMLVALRPSVSAADLAQAWRFDAGRVLPFALAVGQITMGQTGDTQWLLDQGRAQYEAGDYVAALQSLDAALAQAAPGTMGEAHCLAGQCHARLWQWNEAAEEFSACSGSLDIDEVTRERARGWLADAYCLNWQTQLPYSQQLSADYPANAAHRYRVAYAYSASARPEVADPLFRAIISDETAELWVSHYALLSLQLSLCSHSGYQAAISEMDSVAANIPRLRLQALVSKGRVLKGFVKDYQAACDVFEQVLREAPAGSPTATEARVQLGYTTLFGLRDPGRARQILEAALPDATDSEVTEDDGATLHPRTLGAEKAQVEYWLAYCSCLAGSFAEAQSAFQQVADDYPASRWAVAALYMSGNCSASLGQIGPARLAYQAVIEHIPAHSPLILAARQGLDKLPQ